MRSRSAVDHGGDAGSVTAEFAALIPAVVVVLAISLGGLQLATRQLQLQDAAALAARSAARGGVAAEVAQTLVADSAVRVHRRANLVCVEVSTRAAPLGTTFGALDMSASSCALAGGR